MTDFLSINESGLTGLQRQRLDFLWQKGELRAREQDLAQREASLANSIAQEDKRRDSAYFNPQTNKIENAQPTIIGSVLSGLSPPPSAPYDKFSATLDHDIEDSKKHWKKVELARLVIWGRDVFEQLSENARYICEYPTVSSFEEAIELIALDADPDYMHTFELALGIASGRASDEEKAYFETLKTEFEKAEKQRKRLIRRKWLVSLITPSLTWISWPFFAVALFMFISVEPVMNPLIPFALGFYAKKIFVLALFIVGAMFLTDVLGSIYFSLFGN